MKLFNLSYEKKKGMSGIIFIMPWIIGFLLFFAKPLIQSLIFTFQKISITHDGFSTDFVGLDNFKYAFFLDPNFIRHVTSSIGNVFYEVPIIIMFSLFIAIILNQRFRGRVIARAVFFLPVIISSGVLVVLLKNDIFGNQLGSTANVYLFESQGFTDLLLKTGIEPTIVLYFTDIVNRIFDLTWRSGVQILMFLAGLQTIPRSYYEASDIEGATGWDSFWKITVPLVSPIIILNMVYSIIDTFTQYGDTGSNSGNTVVRIIYNTAFAEFNYGYSSAQAWIYFIVIVFILIIVYRIIGRKVFYMVE